VPEETYYSDRVGPAEDQEESGSLVTFRRKRLPNDRAHNNLPVQLSSFIGREKEVAKVEELLDGDTRLVTLYGSGGCGKTRLALAVAQKEVEGFEDGVWWVELASLSDPDLVPRALASALGVREVPDRSLTEELVEHLESRRVLLILDNCEHLVESCAALAGTLLRTCPDLRMLATSREPLRVAGETVWMVPSLSLPDRQRGPSAVGALARYEAIRLFTERAEAVDAGFALTHQNATSVARLCHELDGIPLAIELAAARVRALAVEQIQERLEDSLGLLTTGNRTAPPRHQTLRATLLWSYELLDAHERKLFEHLSVFAGGWDLGAAEAVGAEEAPGVVLDLLSNLVDKSLVVAEKSGQGSSSILRYRMLEPVRQYASELLTESGDSEETRRRHAAYFVALAEQAQPRLRSEVEWLGRLEQENGNLRGALSWAQATDAISTSARLCWALHVFWWIHNHHPEGRRWVEPVIQRREELSIRWRIRTTIVAEVMAFGQGDIGAVERFIEDLWVYSLELGGDAYADSYAHGGYGLLLTLRGDFEPAMKHLEKALPLFREAGEDGQASQTYTWLGTALLLQGDYKEARRSFEDGLAFGRRIRDGLGICNALFSLAQLELAGGDYDAASSRFAEGIAPSLEWGDRGNIAYILEGLGVAAGARGDAIMSARLNGASEAMISDMGLRGHTYYQPDRALYERINAGVRSSLGDAAFEAALTEGRIMAPEQAIEYALGAVGEPAATPTTVTNTVAPEPPAGSSEKPTETPTAGLRIFSLGPAWVEKEGLPLDSPDWIRKPRELLYFLLSHPEGRTKEQIGLALWPEASTSQLRRRFHDTLFRLRRALGAKEWISFQKGRYSFDRSLDYYFDVDAWDQNLSEARGLRSESPEDAIRLLQEAVGLYRGDFLEDFAAGEWALERQVELKRSYQDALLLFGELLCAGERYAEAAEVYRKVILQNRFLEEAHRGLMRSLASLGERGRALRHYEELVGTLEEHLGTTPASETTDLYKRLRAGEEV
jgi:predicted ATPase/DNA-binding SARP family transcriptional activator